jgi:hypothetical protein
MRVVLLVPRRSDGGHRDSLWAWCKARWQALLPDLPVYEGHHDASEGPFNRSAAINRAAALADAEGRWDVAIAIDADVFVPTRQVRAAIEGAAAGKVTWAHRRWRGLHQRETERIVMRPDPFGDDPAASTDMDLLVEDTVGDNMAALGWMARMLFPVGPWEPDIAELIQRTTPISWSCCVAVPRMVWDDTAGMDERFRGWGFEDGAWAALIRGLYPYRRIDGDLYHLFHERSDERIVNGESALTAKPDYVRNALLGRRYMVAAIRDHAVGDLPGEEHLEAARASLHVRNLKKDDKRFLALAARLRMPESVAWRDWWPPLEELRDGAKKHNDQERERERIAERGITLVVHSGGTAENWPTRRGYLERSLASLAAHVSGPIVQKVLYSDWDSRVAFGLEQIAGRHGFYVAGGGHYGYTASMQRLWRYVASRALGPHVFLTEDDFIYGRDVDLGQFVDVLETQPHVMQVALLREPTYQSEIDRGGILGWPVESFAHQRQNGHRWFEHRNYWTANPSLFRRSLTSVPWPDGKSSERLFAEALFRDTQAVAAHWGEGEAYVRHIGEVKAGAGY